MGLFSQKEEKKIAKVKLLGVRTTEQTKVLGTYNSTMYCFLIEYTDGSREIAEHEAKEKEIKELLHYINMD